MEALDVGVEKEIYSVPIDGFYKPLSEIPSQEDIALHKITCSPELMTLRLRELVPLLKTLEFRFVSVGAENTVGVVPLHPSSMNQNGTHQASGFYIISDYVAGATVLAALPGIYVVGMNDRCRAQPTQFWLKSNQVTHLRPGTGLIRAQSSIAQEKIPKLRDALLRKKRFNIDMYVEIFQDGQLIAEANPTIGVYIDDPRFPNIKPSFLQIENAKLSARLVAGLRKDKLSQKLAGEQGKALAIRFATQTPQLPELIEARGIHLNTYLDHNGKAYEQVLVLGIGLDPRPFHYASPKQLWFGIDLQHSIQERRERVDNMAEKVNTAYLKLVPADLRLSGWEDALLQSGFRPEASTVVVMEGFSMYAYQKELSELLDSLHGLLSNQKSRIWVDHITPKMFELQKKEIQIFLSEISRLGEPFITGFTRAEALSKKWVTESQSSSAVILNRQDDAVYNEHKLSIIKPV